MHNSAQVKVGLFFILGVATLLVVYELLGGLDLLTPGLSYTSTFHAANGLRIGDPVRLAGVDVGTVTGLRVVDNAIEVSMRVNRDTVIKTDSVATIKFTSLLGANFIDVSFGSPTAKPLPPGGRIASREGTDLNTLVAEAQDLATSLNKNQQKFFTAIDQVVGTEKGGLKETMTNLNGLLADIRSGKGTLGKLATDDKLYAELQGSFEHLNVISEKVAKGEGTLGKLVTDDTLYNSATDALRKLGKTADTAEDMAPLTTAIALGYLLY